MCTHGTDRKITIEQTIVVDDCIADEIIWLNRIGMHTIGCCCSHGAGNPKAYVVNNCRELAKKYGYELYQDENGAEWVLLKGEEFKEEK
jgi:hypothetical protein